MSDLAYHVVVNALEGASGWTPGSRLAASVAHTIDGHLPHSRYLTAGRVLRRNRASIGAIEMSIRDWLATDLNPATQIIRTLDQPSKAIHGFNTYNASAGLGVRTTVSYAEHMTASASMIVANRALISTSVDPEPCRIGTLSVLDSMMAEVQCNQRAGMKPVTASLVDVAIRLGVAGSASGEVALAFELEGSMSVGELAKRLGCHQRTLERRLREEGLTAEAIRSATRLIRATRRLRSHYSLTEIAIDEGYADQAHMSRAFRASCGMSPSLLRSIA